MSSAEGILTLHDPEMRKLYDLKVIAREIIFARRLQRVRYSYKQIPISCLRAA